MAVEKKQLRNTLRACRSGLSAEFVAAASVAIQRRLLQSAAYRGAATIILYAPKDNEVSTDRVFADAIATRRRVLFPKVTSGKPEIALIAVSDPADLAPGAFGLLEPIGVEQTAPTALHNALICVPGLAFTWGGARLGRGGGYYDRLLAVAGAGVLSVGLAYAFQVLDRLPESLDDQRLNLIITESVARMAPFGSLEPEARTEQGGATTCG